VTVATRAAELTTARRNSLKDSDFAYVDSDGKGHLPIHDESHVRNALSRFSQTSFESTAAKGKAKGKIKAAAQRMGIKVSDDFREFEVYGKPLLVACSEIPVERFAEGEPLPFVRIGEHEFSDSYGLITVTEEDLDSIVHGFEVGARRQDLPLVNEEHIPATYSGDGDVLMGPGAIGWISKMWRDGDTVWFTPDWNAAGERLLADDRYRAVSPELFLSWTDPETGDTWGMTAAGVALTTRPRMKNLAHVGSPLVTAGEPKGRVLACAESLRLAYAQDVHIDKSSPTFSIAYAFPDKKRLPLHTAEALRGSTARFLTVDASEDERDQAWTRVREAAGQLGVSVAESWRALKASEAAAVLMQETGLDDDVAYDVASGMLPPCSYQPPYGMCPGYTRSDPDGDGDADVCLMASRGCNGYIPLQTRASFVAPNAASYYADRSPGGTMSDTDETQKAAALAAGDVVKGADGKVPPAFLKNQKGKGGDGDDDDGDGDGSTKTASEVKATTDTAPPTADAPNPADFAELKNMVLAERQARLASEQAAATRIEAAETRAAAADQRVRDTETAAKLAEVSRELEGLVRTGRITPAERDLYAGEKLAQFAENTWLLDALKQRPASSAVDMKERGTGTETQTGVSDSGRLDQAARALMAERKQSTNPRDRDFHPNYRAALLEVSSTGYRVGT